MNNFLPVKSNNRATPLRNAARIISIMILALLWPARGEAQADLDVSSITEATTLTYKSTSDPAVYAWYYKIGSAGEEVFSGKLTGTNGNCPLITIESKKEVTASDYAGCATLQLEEVTLTATGETNLINTYGTNPICIQTTGVSPSTLKYDGTTEYTSVILDRGGNGYNGGGPLILDAEKAELNIVATKVQSFGIYLLTTNISIKTILKGKINIEAWRAIHIGNSSYLSATPTAEIRCASYEYLYTDVDADRIKTPFLQWKFAEAPASGQPLEIRDASGNPLASPITFTTDGKAKSFAINVTKDTPYTLWLDGKKQKDSNEATSFTATESKYYEFTRITEFLAANWSEYAQTAQVGPAGADVAVDNTTYTVKTSAGLAWIAWVTNSGKKSTDGQNYPSTAGFDDCTVTLANDIALTTPTTGVVTSDFDVNWPTIGEGADNSFKGTFDGGSHKVSGLSITIPNDCQFNGFFGYILGAEVKNLRVEGNIGGEKSIGDDISVGGIVGMADGSKIIACSNAVEISVTKTTTNGGLNIGGIVGQVGSGCNIYSCWNEATLSGESSQVLYIGGIVGINSAPISNCYSSGDVSGTGTSTSECASGGIAGCIRAALSNCYATGSVSATATNSGTASAGGIAGYIHTTGSIGSCLALNAGNKISAKLNNGGSSYKGRIVGHKGGGSISNNYASTKIMLSDDGTTFTPPTTEIGAQKINGADVYLDDVAKAIKTWADSENTKAFTAIGTEEVTGKLPQLKTVNYGNDGLPSAYGNSAMAHQLPLTTSGYLGMPTALELPSNDTETITLSCTDNKWSYKKGTDGESNRFNGAIRMVQSVEKSSNPLIVSTTGDNPTLTFEKVNINLDGAALTIDAGCTLTINTTGDNTSKLASSAASTIANEGILTVKGKGLFIINKSATDTHYGLENSGTFTVDDPSATSVTFHCGNTAIQNTGTLGNPWMEWQFAEAPAGDGNIAFAATDAADQSPAAQSRQDKTFATTVTAGKNYRVWTVDNSDTRTLQQGKTSATPAASVISFKAPAEDAPERNLAVFTDVKDAVTVTVSEPTEGGSISVFYDNNLLAATDAIPNGATLTCKYSAIPGYELGSYMATPSGGASTEPSDAPKNTRKYQIPEDATSVAFKATFDEAPSATITEEDVVEEVPTAPIAGPTVVIPQAEQPELSDESSTIKLLTGNLEEIHKEAVDEVINENVQNHDGLIYAEIALVEVKQDGTKIPIQPSPEHPVKVVYPYPAGTDSDDSFTIVHVKMDGTTEVYSGNSLQKTDAGLEFEVSSFSPFGIVWTKAGSDPGPGPDPGTDPDPGIDPEPTPVFFTVTLPAVEGAVTDPVAGSYSVEAGENFRFFLTLDKDYDESQPVVSTSRNETIEPFGSTSAYIIENIQSAVMITISGIRKNTAVSNATLDSGLRIRTESSALYIETDRRADIRIVSISGSTLASFEAHPGTTRHPLSPGIYIVKAENQVYKVIIN